MAELVVDGPLVLGICVGKHRDVLELAYQGLDLGRGELAAGRLPAQVPFGALALPFQLSNPVGDDGDVAVLLEQGAVPGELGVAAEPMLVTPIAATTKTALR